MKTLNNRTIVKIGVDPRELATIVTVDGYFHSSGHPTNFGTVVESDIYPKGDILNWIRVTPIETDKHSIISNNEVFYHNSKLIKPGVLVRRQTVAQRDILTIREQDFFQVILSNSYGIDIDDFIVIVPNTAHRTIIDEQETYFVHESAIALVVSSKKTKAGSNFSLLNEYSEEETFIAHTEVFDRIAEIDGRLIYFKKDTFRLNIGGKKYVLVRNADFLAEGI